MLEIVSIDYDHVLGTRKAWKSFLVGHRGLTKCFTDLRVRRDNQEVRGLSR